MLFPNVIVDNLRKCLPKTHVRNFWLYLDYERMVIVSSVDYSFIYTQRCFEGVDEHRGYRK